MKKIISIGMIACLLSSLLLSCQSLESMYVDGKTATLFQAQAQDKYQNETDYFYRVEMIKPSGATYAKNLLSEKLQKTYDMLDMHLHSFVPTMNNLDLTQDEIKKVMEHYRADNPQVFWFNGNYAYRYDEKTKIVDQITLSFTYFDNEAQKKIELSKKDIEQKYAQMQLQAQELLAKLPEQASAYEIILFLHDELAKNVTYDKTANFQHTAYGALVEKKAVCDGYASAMQYLLEQVGIETLIVYGADKQDDQENHAWNMVKIDGEYYHLDVTWDLPPQGADFPLYTNFLTTQEQISKRHLIFSPLIGKNSTAFSHLPAIPTAEDPSKWYYRYHDRYLADISDESIKKFGEQVNLAVLQQKDYIQFYFENATDLDNFIEEIQTFSKRTSKYLKTNSNYSMDLSASSESHILFLEFSYH